MRISLSFGIWLLAIRNLNLANTQASVKAFEIHGYGERTLEEDHGDTPRAYLGLTHHLTPNFFMIGYI